MFGVRGEESYISFTVHSEAVDGGFNGRVLADINDSQFTFAPDGSYEIVFSAEKPSDRLVPTGCSSTPTRAC